MKTKLIYIMGFTLTTLLSCSKDDINEKKVDNRLFLEKMAGSVWINTPDGDIFSKNSSSSISIFKFYNNINHPWDKWQNNNLYGCWKRAFSINEGYPYEIVEHSNSLFKAVWSCPDKYTYSYQGSKQDYQMEWEFIDNQLMLNGVPMFEYTGANLSELNKCTDYDNLSSPEYGIIEAKVTNLYTVEDDTVISFQPYPSVEYYGDLWIQGKAETNGVYIGLTIRILGEFYNDYTTGYYAGGVAVDLFEGTGPVCQSQYQHASNLNSITITEITDSWITGTFEFELFRWWYPYSSFLEGNFHVMRQSGM